MDMYVDYLFIIRFSGIISEQYVNYYTISESKSANFLGRRRSNGRSLSHSEVILDWPISFELYEKTVLFDF